MSLHYSVLLSEYVFEKSITRISHQHRRLTAY